MSERQQLDSSSGQTEVPQAGVQPPAPPVETREVTGAYVEIVVETYLRWACPHCQKLAKSTDAELVKALHSGATPFIKCPSCAIEHPIAKRPERLIQTPAELRKAGYNPNLTGAANRVLGNVRR